MNDPSRQVEEFAREWATAEQHGDAAFLEDALAAHTEGDKLGAMVSGVHFKHPATCGGNGRGQLVISR